jgi:hypothetical protein
VRGVGFELAAELRDVDAQVVGLVPVSSVIPPRPRTSTMCSVAYATDDSGSEQNTGRARRFGSSVSARRSLRNGSPTKIRATAAAEDAMRPF